MYVTMDTPAAAQFLAVTPNYLANLRCYRRGPRWCRCPETGRPRYAEADLREWAAARAARRHAPAA
jgi:hypothetical protein